MDSSYIVSDVQAGMTRFQYTATDFLRRLNRVCEFYMKSDVFTDLFDIVETTTNSGFITIPRRYGRVYGVQKGCAALPVRGEFYQFVEFGMGRQDPNQLCMSGLMDLGNDFVTQQDIYVGDVEQSGTLRLVITNAADAGKIWRFDATFTDTDGVDRDVFDNSGTGGAGAPGFSLTSVNPSVDSAVTIKKLRGIQAPTGLKGRWMLYKVIGGSPNWIGTYDPDEIRPRYTRYQTRNTQATIRMYCRRQHVLLLNPTDWVYPDNLFAVDFGFSALVYSDNRNYAAMNEAWLEGKKVLKAEYASKVPYPRVQLTSELGGLGQSGHATSTGNWG